MNWRINRGILTALQNMPFKRKLFLSYSILIIIPLTTIAFFSYNKITGIMLERTLYSASQSFNQTHSYISYKLYKIIRTSDLIATDKQVNDILEKSLQDYPVVDQVEDMNNLVRYLRSMKDEEDIFDVKLYVENGRVYSSENRNIFNLKDVQRLDWYKKLMGSNEKIIGFPNQYFGTTDPDAAEIVSLARKIKSNKNYREIFGLLRIDVEQSKLDDILTNANAIKESYTYLQNSEGLIVASSNASPPVFDPQALRQLGNHTPSNGERMNEGELQGLPVYYEARVIPYTDWTMVTVIPESSVLFEINKLRLEMLVQFAGLGTIAYVFAYYLSVSMTRRLSRIVSRMKRVQQGDLDSIIVNAGRDEIGELTDNYNFMLSRIKSLAEEQYELGQELKNAELRALQSQINPHFLYNTLDLINWLSHKNRIEDIQTVTHALANFYKFSLNKGRDLSTIDYEIRHVSSYVQIQNARFRNKIHLQAEVDDEILPFVLPKITLQPIIENSILHGILEKPEKEGIIRIQGWREQEFVVLKISDDGVGIPEKRLEQIECGCPISERGNHYAIRNINERLRLVFGKPYRLEYVSSPGEGTTVTLKIPARMNAGEEIKRVSGKFS